MGINDFRLRVVGTQFENRDGGSRQEELACCALGEHVTLVREPTNPVDPGAVAVVGCRDVQIGYLGADRAAWIRGKLDRGYDVRATIAEITGRRRGLPLGAILAVNMEGDEPS